MRPATTSESAVASIVPCAASPELQDEVDAARERAITYFRERQRTDGSWSEPIRSDGRLTAWHVLLERYLRRTDPLLEGRLCNHLLETQGDGGGWASHPGAPPSVDATVLAYAALRASGLPAEDPRLVRARRTIERHGGLQATMPATRAPLALLGALPLRLLAYTPPDIVSGGLALAPNIYDLGLIRTVVPATGLLARHRCVRRLGPEHGIAELAADTSNLQLAPSAGRPLGVQLRLGLTSLIVGFLRFRDRVVPWEPADSEALAWIRCRQEEDGSFGGAFLLTALNIMALDAVGDSREDRARVERGLDGLRSWIVDDGVRAYQQAMPATAMQTAMAMMALHLGGASDDEAAVHRAAAWLADHQASGPGDWVRQAVPGTPAGGWSFGGTSDRYPDCDMTAIVLAALRPHRDRHTDAFDGGLAWLLGMQGRGGGWAAWSRDAHAPPLLSLETLAPWTNDPPDTDITARSLELLGTIDDGDALGSKACEGTQRAVGFLRRTQARDGSWAAHWSVCRVTGTGYVLAGLAAVESGGDLVPEGVQFLASVQNPDGGWGESQDSYAQGRYVPGPSNAMSTALALRGLVASGHADSTAVHRGLRWLLAAQRDDGHWDDTAWSGVIIPGDQYIAYPFVPTFVAVQALTEIRDAWGGRRATKR